MIALPRMPLLLALLLLLPSLAFFVGLTIYAIWRKKQFDACCDNGSIKSRNTPPE